MYHNRLQLLKSLIIIKLYENIIYYFIEIIIYYIETYICLNKGNSNDRKVALFNIFLYI